MSTTDSRHRGRAIRKARRTYGPTAGVVFVDIAPYIRAFEWALRDVARIFERFGVALKHRPQLLHNGRKPR